MFAGKEHNFNKYDNRTVTDYGIGYDYKSVMHYSSHAFSSNGEPTITPKVMSARAAFAIFLLISVCSGRLCHFAEREGKTWSARRAQRKGCSQGASNVQGGMCRSYTGIEQRRTFFRRDLYRMDIRFGWNSHLDES